MRCLAWNCHGLGNPRTIYALQKILKKKDPDVLFLSETIQKSCKLDKIRVQYNLHGLFCVDPMGQSGGLAMLWKEQVDLRITSFSKNHIDVEIVDTNDLKWRLTGFYEEPDTNSRKLSWNLLRNLGIRNNIPWICMGDFNEILWAQEKEWGMTRPKWQMKAFRDVLEKVELDDLGFSDHWFTWKRGKTKKTLVKERLDRAVANKYWYNSFPKYKIAHMDCSQLDHSVLLLDTSSNKKTRSNHGKRRKRQFEAMRGQRRGSKDNY
ncbi:hypothetical protein DITRI_Ditri16bG0114600 [Diplodiscus trichospermus]